MAMLIYLSSFIFTDTEPISEYLLTYLSSIINILYHIELLIDICQSPWESNNEVKRGMIIRS